MKPATQVCIVARNEIIREGLSRILGDLGFGVGITAGDATGLVAALEGQTPPDMIILDGGIPDEAVEECERIHRALPAAWLVLMSDEHSVDAIARAFAAGVSGYLAKEIACEPLASALRLVSFGEKIVPTPTVCQLSAGGWKPMNVDWLSAGDVNRLSERELSILRCLARGDANKLIARELEITEATVKVHIKAVLRKLGVLNRTQAAIWAVTRHIVDPMDPYMSSRSLRPESANGAIRKEQALCA